MRATIRCSHCGQAKRCTYRIEERRACKTCWKNWRYPVAQCPTCPRVARLSARVDGTNVCETCESRHRRNIPNGHCAYPTCGRAARLVRGLCIRHYKQQQLERRKRGWCKGGTHASKRTLNRNGLCASCVTIVNAEKRLQRELDRLLGAPAVASHAIALREHWTTDRGPHRVLRTISNFDPQVRAYVAKVKTGTPVDWSSLQALRRRPGGEWLCASCVRAGIVAPPSADIARVDRELQAMGRIDARAAEPVRDYWDSYLLLRVGLRGHYKLRDVTLESDRASLWVAFEFVRHVLQRRETLADLREKDVCDWQYECEAAGSRGKTSDRRVEGAERPRSSPAKRDRTSEAAPSFAPSDIPRLKPFLNWLFDTNRVRRRFDLPKGIVSDAVSAEDETFRAIQARARNDARLPLLVRVALLLLTMCVRYPYEIARVRVKGVRREGRHLVWVRFERGMRQPLEGRDAQLVLQLRDRARGSPWLFPSKPRPGQAMTPHGLCGLIDAAGIDVNLNHLRNAAFRDFLKEFEPEEAVQILGLSPSVAQHWRKRGFGGTRGQREHVNELSRAFRRSARRIAA